MSIKPVIKYSIIALSIISIASMQAATTNIPNLSHQKEKVLFVLSAAQGTIKPEAQGYILALTKVEPDSLWFSNHPARHAGFVPTTQLINHWAKYFSQSSPNGAFVHVGMRSQVHGKSLPMAMELSNPKESANDTVYFNVQSLAGDHIKAGQYQNISLFIDSGWSPCINPAMCPLY